MAKKVQFCQTMKGKGSIMKLYRYLLRAADLLTLCLVGSMISCGIPHAANNTGSAGEAKTSALSDETEQTLSSDTVSAADGETSIEPEPFLPDPDHAVSVYDDLMSDLDTFPLHFFYDGIEYHGFEGFATESEQYDALERGIKTTLNLRHPSIPAVFCLEATVYPEESAYEYVVYIRNDGEENTGIFSDIEFCLEYPGNDPVLSGLQGDAWGLYYTPYEQDLSKRWTHSDVSTSGRPSHGTFPYYNLSYGNGGTFIAIGWPGTWYSHFRYDRTTKTTSFRAGQNRVATYIAPGETLRTPLMGFVSYEGLSSEEQTNAWRHYYINDVMRKIDGELTPTYTGISSMSADTTTDAVLRMLQAYRANGIDIDAIWMDAGWYTGANGETVPWPSTGSLSIDYSRFPDGMSSIGDYAKENDAMFLLWFEPEVVRLDKEAFLAGQPDFKADWLLGKVAEGSWLEGELVNLGDPECREWIFNRICNVLDTTGATGYRQDFNSDPAQAWARNDAKTKGRTGMTENQYVQGYLALWDALIDKYGCLIDSCASGGGRNDLESMKRGVPLHYSDLFDGNGEAYDSKGKVTQALFAWFPYFKNQVYENTLYKLRVNYAPFSLLQLPNALDESANNDWDLLRQAYAEYDLIRNYFYGDYYALTEWKADADRWDARMFYVPESGEGFACVACQEASTSLTETICLKGLDAKRSYHITDLDGLIDVTASGEDLLTNGIKITVPENPYAVILLIKPVDA